MFQVRDDGDVRWLTISNPSRRNAIPFGRWDELAAAFDDFATAGARVLVVKGDGEDFCTGAELGADLSLRSTATAYRAMDGVGAAALALHRIEKPTVAAVDGYAVGAGMNLALGCDVLIATSRARFSEIFVRRGLAVDFGGTWLLPRLVGVARAKDLALTGRMVDAAEASAMGLVSRVVEPDDLESVTREVAADLAAGAPMAQAFIKRGLEASHQMSMHDAVAFEQRAQSVLFTTDDIVEGVAAFVERRDPRFEGR